MSKTKQWRAVDEYIYDEDNNLIASVVGSETNTSQDMDNAAYIAHCVATQPALLEAAEACEAKLTEIHAFWERAGTGSLFATAIYEQAEALRTVIYAAKTEAD